MYHTPRECKPLKMIKNSVIQASFTLFNLNKKIYTARYYRALHNEIIIDLKF